MPELWKTRRREILAGGACLLLLLAVFLFMPRHEGTEEPSDIGTMRIEEVLAAHPSYAQLQELRAEERSLTLLVRDMPAPPEIKPPEAEAAPFDDSVWQKNAQTVISTRVELERERKRLAEVYRKQTEADYEARKKAIDDEYLNAILNINLKIDNQRAMHGPRVSEEELAAERAVWERDREELKRERGARQMALYREWQAQIRARVAARSKNARRTLRLRSVRCVSQPYAMKRMRSRRRSGAMYAAVRRNLRSCTTFLSCLHLRRRARERLCPPPSSLLYAVLRRLSQIRRRM